jgi:hypothetical protein
VDLIANGRHVAITKEIVKWLVCAPVASLQAQ